jgi:serine protease Do
VKLDVRHQGTDKTVTVALGTMPGQRQASADSAPDQSAKGAPHLGVNVAPANDVAGAGGKGLVITGVDPNGPAADSGLKTGDVILDVAGKEVAKAADVTAALTEAKSQGKHSVLMRVKSADATRFVSVSISNG